MQLATLTISISSLPVTRVTGRDEAIMLVKLSIILSSNSIILPIMLTDFTCYSQNYAWFNAHGISDS